MAADVQSFNVHLRELILYTEPEFIGNGEDLRLAITGHWNNRKTLHGHYDDGTSIYWLPPVRYLADKQPRILAIQAGLIDLENMYSALGETLHVGSKAFKIKATEIVDKKVPFGLSGFLLTYCSLSLWIALNQKRYEDYICYGDKRKRAGLLENIFVGNLLSLSKGVGYNVKNPILAKIHFFDEKQAKFKGIPLAAFSISITTNFIIPDSLGLGRHTSIGYGRFKEI